MWRWVASAATAAMGISVVALWGADKASWVDEPGQTERRSEISTLGISSYFHGTKPDLTASDIFDIYLGPSQPVPLRRCGYPIWPDRAGFPEVKLRKPRPDFSQLDFHISVMDHPYRDHSSRLPLKFPPRFLQGNHSGYCKMKFDISSEGDPIHVTAILCTDEQLREVSMKSVLKWRYAPYMKDELAQPRYGEETIIRFELNDENGNLLPLPPGF